MSVDFSQSGLEGTGLPSLTLDSLSQGGDPRILGWLREAILEGDRINRSDPAYDRIEIGQRYVSGDQKYASGNVHEPPSYIPATHINESRKVVNAHVSALTDLKPLFAYKATNPALSPQADLVNRLTIAWWINSRVDIDLGHVIKYGLAGGTGDCVMEWNPYGPLGGDITLSARDPRDTIPIRPATHNRSIQAWEGLILRESHTVNVMRALFPTYANVFRPTTDSLLSTLMGRFRQVTARFMSPANDTLSGLNMPAMASRVRSGEILLYKTYLNDRTQNLTTKPIPMGRPGAGWQYTVPPGGYMYPYKRLIVSTPDTLLYDGPSSYWHGRYPVARFKPWDLPWQFLGQGILHDLIPVQDAINQSVQDILLGIRKWMNPPVKYNTAAVSQSTMRLFDPRRPGGKLKMNPSGVQNGFELMNGPPAEILQVAAGFLATMKDTFADLSGTPNLQQLLALRQIPSADTIEKYWEALTPELRQEGRMIEVFLSELAEQAKSLRFQFESNARRVLILGDAGNLLEDFDFDPNNMVPAMQPGSPGYKPEFDASLPRDQRAQSMAKAIVFTLAPNSILSMNATEGKMMRLQLSRMGMYDFWSLMESLEIPNIGAPPKIPLPLLKDLSPEEIAALIQQLQTPQGLMALSQKYTLTPDGQLLEIREPITVTERLQAQAMLGIGMQANAAGRKATGQQPPQMEQKGDGRTTVTESRHDKGPGSSSGPHAHGGESPSGRTPH